MIPPTLWWITSGSINRRRRDALPFVYFYINGKETCRTNAGGVSQNPEYLLLSCEFAGENGVQNSDRHGTGKISLTPAENWPAEFKVDYVRCYQYKDLLG